MKDDNNRQHACLYIKTGKLQRVYFNLSSMDLPIKPEAIHATPPIIIVTNIGFRLPSGFSINIHIIYAGISTAPAIQKLR